MNELILMASIRRTLSPLSANERAVHIEDCNNSTKHSYPIGNSTSTSSSSSVTDSNFISYGRALIFGNSPTKLKPRAKSKSWKRPVIHLILCFIIGMLVGFTPFSIVPFNESPGNQDFSNSGTIETINAKGASLEAEHERLILDENVKKASGNNVDSGFSPLKFFNFSPRKLLIIITPTYNRPLQAYYLHRLAHTLRLANPPILWLVVEMGAQSMETAELLRKTGVMYRHLVCETNITDIKDRGTHQRNTALSHIERHRLDGIVYFADDDNVYSLELFEQMRNIRRFGTWPVGMLAHSKNKAILEGPVCDGTQVVGWHTNVKSKRLRRFHVDMSGFAFNSTILWDPQRWHRRSKLPIRQLDTVKEGFQETTFIEQIVEDEFQMEGLPYNCSKIMVWHLHLEAPGLAYPQQWIVDKNLDVVAPVKRR